MIDSTQFKLIKIGIASPEDVIEWARGPQNEVTKPETIQYSSFKPVPDGLFCERIFGPTKDYECHCKRYKKIKYKGQTCPQCHVDITTSKVRRERMGYIKLNAPVSHIWYLKTVPSPICLLLDMAPKNLEHVLYYREYMVTRADTENIENVMPVVNKAIAKYREQVLAELEEDLADLQKAFDDRRAEEGDAFDEEKRTAEFREQRKAFEEFHNKKIHDLEKGKELLESKRERDVIESDDFGYFKKLREQVMNRELLGDDTVDLYQYFNADIGAEAVKTLLKKLNLAELKEKLVAEVRAAIGSSRQMRIIKRLEVVDSFLESGAKPEWMILENIPVIPPDLRPMVQLDGGRFATSDLNDLYRRVINRNNTLNKIIQAKAPQIMVNHQKNLIQEAVDALIDNDRKQRKVNGSNGRALKSLSDMLKGKEGRFRKNLLGKRVDYSGRSVIVVGPSLKIYQCGLPKEMALELFKPFVMKEMVKKGLVSNIKLAKKSIDRLEPTVWDPLEDVIKEHPVLLNRAPTLHRLGIQAFEPILVDGKAIQLHPLVCAAFNADFDGDQMAVHVPLSAAAQAEARTLMLASHNLFSPANGKPIVAPSQDVVLGCFYVTMRSNRWQLKYAEGDVYDDEGNMIASDGQSYVVKDGKNQKCRFFANPKDAILCYETKNIDIHEPITVRMVFDGKPMKRNITVGRLIFNSILPDNMGYIGTPFVKGDKLEYRPEERLALDGKDQDNVTEGKEQESNESVAIGKKWCGTLITECHERNGHDVTVTFLDDMKALGYKYATRAGMSIAITDMDITSDREEILKETEEAVKRINMNFNAGMVSAQVRRESVLQSWLNAQEDIGKSLIEGIEQFNQIAIITMSGARGSTKQISQLAGMRGLMSDPMGNAIEDMPVKSNFHEGLSVLEYFVSTHGARKGLADTALRTADAGYLTRRLVDVAQDVIIREEDCHTDEGIDVKPLYDDEGSIIEDLAERIKGRTAFINIGDPNLPGAVAEENIYRFFEPVRHISRISVDDPEKAVEDKKQELLEKLSEIKFSSPDEKQEAEAKALEEAEEARWTTREEWLPADPEPVYIAESRLADFFKGNDKFDFSDGRVIFRKTGEILSDEFFSLQTEAGGITPEHAIVLKNEIISDAQAKVIDRVYSELTEARADDPDIIIPEIKVRSPFTCKSTMGVCAKCYGRDLSLKTPVEVGTAVGIIAAQSIGEPGTQLTMRTFHGGGVAGKYLTGVANVKKKKQETLRIIHNDSASGILNLDISAKDIKEKNRQVQNLMKVLEDQVHGLLRVQELFEARKPKGQAIVADAEGEVIEANQGDTNQVTIRSQQKLYGRKDDQDPEKTVLDKDKIQHLLGKRLAKDILKPGTEEELNKGGWQLTDNGVEKIPGFSGRALSKASAESKRRNGIILWVGADITEKNLMKLFDNGIRDLTVEFTYLVPHRGNLMVEKGQVITKRGHRITEGPLDPHKVLELEGERGLMSYVVDEIQKVYKSQGVDINDKHVEVIVRQMLRKVRIIDPGDTDLKKEQLVDKAILSIKNRDAEKEGGQPAEFVPVLKGITDASLATESFLSAASFQKTTRILTTAAVRNKKDHLIGIKENVIIGRLIPAGTGIRKYRDLKLYDKAGNILSQRRRNYVPETDATPLERFVWTKGAKDVMASLGCQTVGDVYCRVNEIRGKGAGIEKEIFGQLTEIIRECTGDSGFRLDFRKISQAAAVSDENGSADTDASAGGATDFSGVIDEKDIISGDYPVEYDNDDIAASFGQTGTDESEFDEEGISEIDLDEDPDSSVFDPETEDGAEDDFPVEDDMEENEDFSVEPDNDDDYSG